MLNRQSIAFLAALATAGTSCRSPSPPATLEPSPADYTVEGPLKFTPRPTSPAITPIDLMSRLYIFADDSMMGRDDGGPLAATKATTYIERELQRLGLTPAGDSGTFFQAIGYRTVVADARSAFFIDGLPIVLRRDFAPVARVGLRPIRAELPVVFGGALDSTARITGDQARGKLVMLVNTSAGQGGRGGRGAGPPLPPALASAAAILVVQGDSLGGATAPVRGLVPSAAERAAAGPPRINITRSIAQRLLEADVTSAQPGAAGKNARLDITFIETPHRVRNVVAIARGRDRRLRNEYVALGAHSDHIGFTARPLDHDSVRAYNRVMRPRGANDSVGTPTAEQWTQIRAIRDSLGKLHPARRDSISNGADDDGSGSVVLLEIAEALARGSIRSKRSVIFVWHAAEEDGLLGSRYFTDHPPVPRQAIVAQLNTDMIGRGRLSDHAGGGPDYLRVIGSRRLSTELGDLAERVNTTGKHGFVFDYSYDVAGHPMNSYCRSDHYNYARFGIPIVYIGTGVQADYHMVSDEPQYIDYVNMARRASYMAELMVAVGNLGHRPVVDKPKPDPLVPCRQ